MTRVICAHRFRLSPGTLRVYAFQPTRGDWKNMHFTRRKQSRGRADLEVPSPSVPARLANKTYIVCWSLAYRIIYFRCASRMLFHGRQYFILNTNEIFSRETANTYREGKAQIHERRIYVLTFHRQRFFIIRKRFNLFATTLRREKKHFNFIYEVRVFCTRFYYYNFKFFFILILRILIILLQA